MTARTLQRGGLVLLALLGSTPLMAQDSPPAAAAGTSMGGVVSEAGAVARLRIPATVFVEQQPAAAWQQQRDDAVARKASGRNKMFFGIAGMGAGVLIGTLATESCLAGSDFDCTGESHAWVLGSLVSAGGGGVFLWGLVQWIDANSDIGQLDARRPTSAAASTSVLLTSRQSLRFSIGARTTAAYRVTW